MFGVNGINGSVQWLGIPAPLRNYGPPYTNNILATSPDWVTGGTDTNPNWGSQPGGPYGSVAVLWSGLVRSMPAYVRRILKNTHSAACHIRDDLLRDNRMVRMQSISISRSILHDCLVNWQDYDWDNLWDDPVDQ